jgi:hypothetical protein
LLSDIAVGANLSTCLHCRNRIGHGQGKLRTARGTDATISPRVRGSPVFCISILTAMSPILYKVAR